jgi:integrase
MCSHCARATTAIRTGASSSRLTGDRLRTALARACTAGGVPAFSPHDLRHRRVSLMHLAGVPWARIGEQVGHDDLMTTARAYTHVVADERELTHVVADERELDYQRLLRSGLSEGESVPVIGKREAPGRR